MQQAYFSRLSFDSPRYFVSKLAPNEKPKALMFANGYLENMYSKTSPISSDEPIEYNFGVDNFVPGAPR